VQLSIIGAGIVGLALATATVTGVVQSLNTSDQHSVNDPLAHVQLYGGR
jgi:tetrahydromethanopterin S-methyltransferase subunit E